MTPVVPPDAPDTVWQGFLRGWPITAAAIGVTGAIIGVLARWVFGRIVEDLQENTREAKLLRTEIGKLRGELSAARERISRVEGIVEAHKS